MIRTTAILLTVTCLASADPSSAKILDLKTMQIGDVGKLQPAVTKDNINIKLESSGRTLTKLQFYYEFIESYGTHAMLVRERLNQTIDGVATTTTGVQFGVQGIPTEGLDKGDRVNLNKYVFEFVAEMALNPNKKFVKTKILKVK